MLKITKLVSILVLFFIATVVYAQDFAFRATENPIIKHKLTSDPSALVYKDKVYLYTGHDTQDSPYKQHNPQNVLLFSSSDMENWTEHPIPLRRADFAWSDNNSQLWATSVVEKGGKFYLYTTLGIMGKQEHPLAVAVADNPEGPFVDAKGAALINDASVLDPFAFVDDDGQAYLFWGNGRCFYSKLQDNMIELENNRTMLDLPGYSGGAHVHKKDGWYYLSYAQGFPAKIVYAMSRSITGPWEYKGILNELAGNSATNHHSMIEFKNKWYFFYHNGALGMGGVFSRSVCVDYLEYNKDKTLKRIQMTTEGVSTSKK